MLAYLLADCTYLLASVRYDYLPAVLLSWVNDEASTLCST
jgi:hypothetical protein